MTELTGQMEAPREEQEDTLRVLHATISRYRERDPAALAEARRAAFRRTWSPGPPPPSMRCAICGGSNRSTRRPTRC